MNRETPVKGKPFVKPAGLWLIGGISCASVILALIGFNQFKQFQANRAQQDVITTPAPPPTVTALGRLEPKDEVIKVSAPSSLEGTLIKELLVKEGTRLNQGDVIAILDSRSQREASLRQAQKQVTIAEAKLSQVQAGAKSGEINAQAATIARLEAQLEGEREVQTATIARLKAELAGEKETVAATISRLEAELKGDTDSIAARISRLEAQLQGEILSGEATVNRIAAQVENAQAEYNRYLQLYREGVVAVSLLDSKRLTLETSEQQLKEAKATLAKIVSAGEQQLLEEKANQQRASTTREEQINETTATRRKTVATLEEQIREAEANLTKTEMTLEKQIEEARATLERIAEVRPVDVEAATAEVQSAEASVQRAQADLDQAYIKSPINGQVLKIHSRPGEVVGSNGIVEIGNTNQMYVTAEVYESDVNQIKVGQRATITSGSLKEELVGSVTEIGLKIGKKDVLNTDPAADVDARVVEVKIRLDPESSLKVVGFTNMQVEVKIFVSQ